MTDKRTYQREHLRRKRANAIAAKNAHTLRCQAMLANRRPCRTPLQSRFVDGETVPFCPTCDRKARGVCTRCGEAPVTGQARKALYCAPCHKIAKHDAYARYKDRHKAALRRKERTRMADPEVRADRNAYKRLYRKAVPTKVAAYKQAYLARHREHVLAYHVAYRAKHAEERRERERLRARGELPPRACLTCPTIISGRAKRCDACKRNDRQRARATIAARMAGAA